uniref:Phosphatidylinositol transfer protein cytoplasmic 1b n=1 Tax=Astyanax mexicanus TaxID=7994 RepID=A0A8B9KE02_ASTMX
MLMKEYRICMPLTVEEYQIGQLYMISKHSHEQSGGGEGVEVVRNEPDTHPVYGLGQVTEKRIYLNSKLPSWMRKFVPMIFYVTETAWNFYPYTCSFLPKLNIRIETRFENDNGSNENVSPDTHTHTNIQDILLVGHRQAVAWTDEWHGMSLEEVREFEKKLQLETNKLKICTDVPLLYLECSGSARQVFSVYFGAEATRRM